MWRDVERISSTKHIMLENQRTTKNINFYLNTEIYMDWLVLFQKTKHINIHNNTEN